MIKIHKQNRGAGEKGMREAKRDIVSERKIEIEIENYLYNIAQHLCLFSYFANKYYF